MNLDEMTDQQFVAYMSGLVLMQIGKGDFQGAMWTFFQNTSQRLANKLKPQTIGKAGLRIKLEKILNEEGIGKCNTRYVLERFDKEF